MMVNLSVYIMHALNQIYMHYNCLLDVSHMALMSQEEYFGCDCPGAGIIRYEPSFAAVEGVLAADSVSLVSVQGRLRSHAAFWLEDLKASSFVAGIVTSGYRLPFISISRTKFQKNHRSAFKNACFVSSVVR